jgi:hypothetical protein
VLLKTPGHKQANRDTPVTQCFIPYKEEDHIAKIKKLTTTLVLLSDGLAKYKERLGKLTLG